MEIQQAKKKTGSGKGGNFSITTVLKKEVPFINAFDQPIKVTQRVYIKGLDYLSLGLYSPLCSVGSRK